MNKHHPPFSGQPFPPYSQRRSTSFDAARSINARNWREKLCRYIHRRHVIGETCDKCEELFGLSHSNASARLGELEIWDLKSDWIIRIRETVPKQLFTIDWDQGYAVRIVAQTRRMRDALVYFHLDHYDDVMRHYNVAPPVNRPW